MPQVSSRDPFQVLSRLDRLGHAHHGELPAGERVRDEWAGIGFRIGGRRYIAAMGEVTEILSHPDLSRIPHTRPWVRGIANVRGNLLPVMDLSAYLAKGSISLNRHGRVLVMDQGGLVAGLLVEEVLGLRHFFAEQWQRETPESDPAVRPYVSGGFERDDGYWPVFSMAALARHPQFLKIAE